MLKIQSGQFIDIQTTQGFDPYGLPEVQLTIEGNTELMQMQTDIITLRGQIDVFLRKQEEEQRLREQNPALKDIHDKYQIVYELVKKADHATI
jgi:hypothetical protein